jgi:Uri superfamily endonuclease
MSVSSLSLRVRQLVGGVPVDSATLAHMGAQPGAYVLVMELARPVLFSRPALGEARFSGWLAYVGSARGSGGIAARLGRHFRPDKKVRWHVDELTNTVRQITAVAVPGMSECGLVAQLVESGEFVTAFKGFGSSDCHCCEAHLLQPVGAWGG